MRNHSSRVCLQSIDLDCRVVHDRCQCLLSEYFVKTTIVENSVTADDALEENFLNSFLLDQQLVEAEEPHDIANENLLGGILLVFKSDRLEEVE